MKMTDIAVLLNRLALGLMFVFAGIRKLVPDAENTLLDKASNFAGFVASQAPLPEALGRLYGYALPPIEVFAGVLLVIGYKTKPVTAVIALMLLSFLIAASSGGWWPAKGPAFPPNVILLTLAIWLMVHGGGKLSLDRK